MRRLLILTALSAAGGAAFAQFEPYTMTKDESASVHFFVPDQHNEGKGSGAGEMFVNLDFYKLKKPNVHQDEQVALYINKREIIYVYVPKKTKTGKYSLSFKMGNQNVHQIHNHGLIGFTFRDVWYPLDPVKVKLAMNEQLFYLKSIERKVPKESGPIPNTMRRSPY